MKAVNFVSFEKIKQLNRTAQEFNFDLERVDRAIASKKIEIPAGLTKEQLRQFIIANR